MQSLLQMLMDSSDAPTHFAKADLERIAEQSYDIAEAMEAEGALRQRTRVRKSVKIPEDRRAGPRRR